MYFNAAGALVFSKESKPYNGAKVSVSSIRRINEQSCVIKGINLEDARK
jgi:hypothetical protein